MGWRKKAVRGVLIPALVLLLRSAAAHPGSGIEVAENGDVYFVHAMVGVWRAPARGGELELLDWPHWHFLAADPGGRFAAQRWPRFPDGEIEAAGGGAPPDEPAGEDPDGDERALEHPAFLLSSSFPLVVAADGALVCPVAEADGRVHLKRTFPGGEPGEFALLPVAMEIGYEGDPIAAQWIHGLAAAPDGSLVYAEQSAVRRVAPDGTVTTLAERIAVPGCVHPPAVRSDRTGPALRDIAVAADGSVYAAASACSALLRISPEGEVTVALRSDGGWSPTGVAIHDGDVYVLENLYIEAESAGDWLPRVRRLSTDGTVTTVATVPERPR